METKISQMDSLLTKLSSVHSALGALEARMNAHLQTLAYAPPAAESSSSTQMGAPSLEMEPALPTANTLVNCIQDRLTALSWSLDWLETI